MASAALYTPEVLGLATSLAAYPLDKSFELRGEARSRACGSTLALGLRLDDAKRVSAIGLRCSACAIGQAAAAIFARHVIALSADEIDSATLRMARWLGGEGDLPDWPGLAAIERARDYPARHGAIMLAWQAASDALSSNAARR